jgi:hypothetical protein
MVLPAMPAARAINPVVINDHPGFPDQGSSPVNPQSYASMQGDIA